MGVDSDPVARISGTGILPAPLGVERDMPPGRRRSPFSALTGHLNDGDTLTGTDSIPAPLFAVLTLA
jgi:hypothetical protein